MKEDVLKYYDYIRRLSESKCSSKEDAEDLISETFLAAYSYLYHGGTIKHPKTWLANTLMHKFNSYLRRKYNQPVIVDHDTLDFFAADEDEDYDMTEEAAELRRELLYLSKTTREVLIRRYYNGSSVADIAKQLGIPEGTVKSRLSAGREKIKKGLGVMVEKKNNIPGSLNVSWSGADGPNHEPTSLVEGDLIVQNLLILAYEKPLTIVELADAIGIPTVYVEPIVEKLVNGELMAETDGGKYYTDFIIYKPDDQLKRFDSQLKFVDERFERFWSVISELISEVDALNFSKTLNTRQLRKLERYAVLRALQAFQINLSDDGTMSVFPNRRDGGRWIAKGWAFTGGYDGRKYREANEYTVLGGHRTNGGPCDYVGAKYLRLCEFDTTLWDNPYRWFNTCGYDTYFKEIRNLLWCIYKDIAFEKGGISNIMIEGIDKLIECTGLITRENGKLEVDIPVMHRDEYKELESHIKMTYDKLVSELGEEYRTYLANNMLEIPAHIKSIKQVDRYMPATIYLVMAVIRQAYNKGLHLADVDYCCPPVVLVYDE